MISPSNHLIGIQCFHGAELEGRESVFGVNNLERRESWDLLRVYVAILKKKPAATKIAAPKPNPIRWYLRFSIMLTSVLWLVAPILHPEALTSE